MQYRTHRLIKSCARETAALTLDKLERAAARAKDGFERLDSCMTVCWHESRLRSRLIRRGKDAARGITLMRARGYLGLCLTVCGLMSLGFLVVNPPSVKLSHRVRIDVSRPMVTTLSAGEAEGLGTLSAYELAVLYEAGTGKKSDWLHAGPLNYEEAFLAGEEPFAGSDSPHGHAAATPASFAAQGWQSARSPLGVKNGKVLMRTSLGPKSLATLGAVALSAQSSERPVRSLKKFAAGTAEAESLLAELSLQGADVGLATRIVNARADLAPNWGSGRYGTGIFAEPRRHWSGQYLAASVEAENFCPQERMEQASWLNMLYASHTRNSIYTVKQAGHYRPYVERFSSHYSLQPSLVYAIMRVESGFNPLAISRANALGLMQVVPETAGNEVNAFLRGKKTAPKPEVLFTPESNIEYGTAYLHLLTTRHFKDVKNPLSRELCAIAAYNGGPNAVYRVFNRDRNRAVEQINKLTSEQLYAKLVTGLASQETRDYLPKVLAARNDFLRGQAKIR